MNILRLIAIALLLQAAPAPQPAASVEGTVVKMETGQPVAKAVVELKEVASSVPPSGASPGLLAVLSSMPQASATTAADGKFAFPNVRPGTYRLTARLPGYVLSEYGQRMPNGKGTPITFAPGQILKDIRLGMTPAGSISGRVIGDDGEPVSRAQVQALKYAYLEGGGRSLIPVQAVVTDDRGEYRLFWLPSGEYYVSAVPTDPRLDSIPVLVPAGGLDATAQPTIVNTSGMRIRLILPSRADLTPGRTPLLFDSNTGQISSGGVTVSTRTLDDGTAVEEAFVPVYFPGVTDDRSAGRVEVRAGVTASGVDIAVAPARVYRIRGVVEAPASNAQVRITIQLLRQDTLSVAGATVVSPGVFEIAGVVPGSYVLTGSTGGLVPVEVGNADVYGVRLPAAATVVSISGRVSVEGRADTRSPPLVRLVKINTPNPYPLTAPPVAPDGSFSISVGPGDYQVTVNDQYYLKSVRLGSEDGLSSPLHIEGPPAGLLDVVAGTDTGAVGGRVVDARRDPAANVKVVLVPEDRRRTSLYKTAVTDGGGRFQIDNLAPGAYKAFAWEEVEEWAWQNAEFMGMYEDRGKPVVIGHYSKDSIELTAIPFQR